MLKLPLIHFIFLLLISATACAQEADSTLLKNISITDRALHAIDNKYSLLDKMIQRKTEKMLRRMQKKELALQNKLQQTDSLKAQGLFAGTQAKYQDLLVQLKSPIDKNINNPLKEYIPGLDSIQTALHFLEHNNINLPVNKLQSLQALGKQIRNVQGSLQKANDVQQYIKEREQQLKNQLENSGVGKKLAFINKEAFYYQQQLAEYKSLLNDKKKLERKLLASVRELPAFKEFMKKNSYLGQLFGLPDNYGSAASLIGLQTKDQVQQILAQRFGSILPGSSTLSNPGQFVSQQIQGGQQQIQQLQNRVSYLGLGGGSTKDLVMPQFQPNKQKTKKFLKRLDLHR